MTLEINKEKIKGKYFIVARENGKFRARKKFSKKFTKEIAIRLYKKNRTFDEEISKTIISTKTGTEEVVDYRKPNLKNISKRTVKYQYVVNALLDDGATIEARSSQYPRGYPIASMKDEAMENIYYLLAKHFNLEYDMAVGKQQEKHIKSLQEGLVYYHGERYEESYRERMEV